LTRNTSKGTYAENQPVPFAIGRLVTGKGRNSADRF
jgi:hypothetical protein